MVGQSAGLGTDRPSVVHEKNTPLHIAHLRVHGDLGVRVRILNVSWKMFSSERATIFAATGECKWRSSST